MFNSTNSNSYTVTIGRAKARLVIAALVGFSSIAGGTTAFAGPIDRDSAPVPVFEDSGRTPAPDPVGPVGPVGPVDPVDPIGPVGPVGPVGPIAPADPIGPADPVEPLEPTMPDAPDDAPVATSPVETTEVDAADDPVIASLNAVAVSADSVVGHVVVDADPSRRITVRWGDGEVTTRTWMSPFWTSSLDVRHAYADERDGDPFTHFVTIEAEDFSGNLSTTVRRLDIVPRYLVTTWNASFRMLEHCDPFYEEYSEWDITRTIDGVQTDFWEDDRQTSAGVSSTGILVTYPFKRLPNSLIHREMTMADPAVYLRYTVYEDDKWWDDYSGTLSHALHPTQGTGTRLGDMNSDCHSQIRFDYQVVLLQPGLYANDGQFVLA